MKCENSCIWIFKRLNDGFGNYLSYTISQEKTLRYVLNNNENITYIRKFARSKKSLSNDAKISHVWLVFDASNGDELTYYYVWVYKSKKKALKKFNEHKENKSSSRLSRPQKFFFEK